MWHLNSSQGQDLRGPSCVHGVEGVGVDLPGLLVGGSGADDVGDPGGPGDPGRHDGGHRVAVETSGDITTCSSDWNYSGRDKEQVNICLGYSPYTTSHPLTSIPGLIMIMFAVWLQNIHQCQCFKL